MAGVVFPGIRPDRRVLLAPDSALLDGDNLLDGDQRNQIKELSVINLHPDATATLASTSLLFGAWVVASLDRRKNFSCFLRHGSFPLLGSETVCSVVTNFLSVLLFSCRVIEAG